jgi:hypothetical protein
MWKKLKGTFKGDPGDDANSIISRRTSSTSQVPPLSQRGSIEYPPESFKAQVMAAAFETMTVAVEIWRQGNLSKEEVPSVASARLLLPGFERLTHLPQSYSFAKFTDIFEQKINENDPAHPIEIQYGYLGYFASDGEHKRVRNQDNFEVAINHLYLNRGHSDVLKFIFQPEPKDAAIDRKTAEAAARAPVAEPATNYPFVAGPSGAKPSRDSTAWPLLAGESLTQSISFPGTALSGNDTYGLLTPDPTPLKGENQGRAIPVAGVQCTPSAQGKNPETPVSSTDRVSRSNYRNLKHTPKSEGEAATNIKRSISHGEVASPQTSPTKRERKGLSKFIGLGRATTPTSEDGQKEYEATAQDKDKAVLKKPQVPPRPLTDAEVIARFQTMWEEVGRTSFKIGGNDEEFLDKSSLKSAHEEEAELPEEEDGEEEDDNDDDIPQEDRVVAM